MKYKAYLILFSMLLLGSQAAHGQELRYRVELLVLRHLDGHSDREPVSELSDFSNATDLLTPATEGSVPEPSKPPTAQPGLEAGTPGAVQAGTPGMDQPRPPIALVETQGEVMQQAWRRLHSANGLRPELYVSWEQGASAGSPKIRIHDQSLLFEQDPNGSTQGASLQDGTEFQLADEAAAAELPRYYRLDGTARLRVSRFLNLDLDIEFREPADPGELPAAAPQSTSALPSSSRADSAQPSPDTADARAWTVYAIQQSRQFQIEDMQYFDGPVIAVLALVSRVEPLPQEVR